MCALRLIILLLILDVGRKCKNCSYRAVHEFDVDASVADVSLKIFISNRRLYSLVALVSRT
jgi:hypothetical protein